jgi:hypothetical protein
LGWAVKVSVQQKFFEDDNFRFKGLMKSCTRPWKRAPKAMQFHYDTVGCDSNGIQETLGGMGLCGIQVLVLAVVLCDCAKYVSTLEAQL